jgi:hypothetical protein
MLAHGISLLAAPRMQAAGHSTHYFAMPACQPLMFTLTGCICAAGEAIITLSGSTQLQEADPDTRLSMHICYMRMDASFPAAAEYRQLWQRHTSTLAAPPTSKTQLHDALVSWHAWGTDPQQQLSPQQQELTAGPATTITTWRRATINGTMFREEAMDPTDTERLGKKSIGSYFLARMPHATVGVDGGYRFQLGRAVFFFQADSPGTTTTSIMQEFVCAK